MSDAARASRVAATVRRLRKGDYIVVQFVDGRRQHFTFVVATSSEISVTQRTAWGMAWSVSIPTSDVAAIGVDATIVEGDFLVKVAWGTLLFMGADAILVLAHVR